MGPGSKVGSLARPSLPSRSDRFAESSNGSHGAFNGTVGLLPAVSHMAAPLRSSPHKRCRTLRPVTVVSVKSCRGRRAPGPPSLSQPAWPWHGVSAGWAALAAARPGSAGRSLCHDDWHWRRQSDYGLGRTRSHWHWHGANAMMRGPLRLRAPGGTRAAGP
jgi:hypothetical protein